MSLALVDHRISQEEVDNLKSNQIDVIKCPPSSVLYDAVSGHPDMLLHIISDKTILVHSEIESNFTELLQNKGFKIMFSNKKLEDSYPGDIILNGLNLKNFFVHNLKHTDSKLLNHVQEKKIIHVNQGYSKCSTAVVSENAIMTSDVGIAKVLSNEKVDVLILPPGDILLPGLNYGFIGGCCGLLNEKVLAFYGDLSDYTYGKEVLQFLKKHRVEPMYLRKGKLIDRGSLYLI